MIQPEPGQRFVNYIDRLVDLTRPEDNRIYNMTVEDARERVNSGDPAQVRSIDGSFALVAREGKRIRMARSIDRLLRYFIAKRHDGPTLVVADRIDAIFTFLKSEGLEEQFHPSYTRMVPAHYIQELKLIGCPDPNPVNVRFFTPQRNTLPADLDAIGARYMGVLADEIGKWLRTLPENEPVGVPFSGGIDSGSVFLLVYHVMREFGMNPARLKAFTLSTGDGADLDQARRFLEPLGLSLFLEPVEVAPSAIDVAATIRVMEDYKPLDVQSGAMALALCRAIRERYPKWRFLVDGDGGDENLKDYPIEENSELTVSSVLNNLMLYQEGWGVESIKHSLTYSGGQSRGYARTYATGRHCGFDGFSPYTLPNVIEVAEGVPFIALTNYDVPRLYSLKGEIVSRGVRAVTGMEMPVFEKRRFQHGAAGAETRAARLPVTEKEYRKLFQAAFAL
ncbi:MAG: asparagine synthetase B family protein [Chloroflexi bacterium]|nr:asparagine synthetase B family protein [Chloroflexota bacterium]